MGELNFCTISDILKFAFERLIVDLSLDLDLPYLLSRFYHNKGLTLGFATLRCYFLYFDISQIIRFVPFLFVPAIVYAFLRSSYRKWLFLTQLLMPFFFIFNVFDLNLAQRIHTFEAYYISIGVIGIVKYLVNKKESF